MWTHRIPWYSRHLLPLPKKCRKRTKRIIKDFLTHMVPSFEFIFFLFHEFFVFLLLASFNCSVCDLRMKRVRLWLIHLCICLCMWFLNVRREKVTTTKKNDRKKNDIRTWTKHFLRLGIENHLFHSFAFFVDDYHTIWKIEITRVDCLNANIT